MWFMRWTVDVASGINRKAMLLRKVQCRQINSVAVDRFEGVNSPRQQLLAGGVARNSPLIIASFCSCQLDTMEGTCNMGPSPMIQESNSPEFVGSVDRALEFFIRWPRTFWRNGFIDSNQIHMHTTTTTVNLSKIAYVYSTEGITTIALFSYPFSVAYSLARNPPSMVLWSLTARAV
jgi:hypothetical protein